MLKRINVNDLAKEKLPRQISNAVEEVDLKTQINLSDMGEYWLLNVQNLLLSKKVLRKVLGIATLMTTLIVAVTKFLLTGH